MMAYKKRNSTLKRVILVAMSIIYVAALFAYRGMQSVPEEHSGFHSRRILSTEDNTTSAPQTPSSNQTNSRYTGSQPAEKKCNEPSISHFPKDVFTQHQRRYGAVLLHTFLRLDLSEDVAGATFMAAGSSAPELFTSLIGVLITKGDVGVGTVVGSAVFNLLVIIALCGTFAGQVVQLTKWPLIRDSACYLLSIGALIGVIYDNQVTWFESTTMMCMYILYIVLMKFNPTIVNAFEVRKNKKSEIMNGDTSTKLINDNQPLVEHKLEITASSPEIKSDLKVRYTFDHRHGSHNNIFISNPENRQKWRELTMRVMLSERFTPTTRFRAACHVMLSRRGLIQSGEFGKEEKDIVFSNGHAKLADEEKDISTESGGSDDLVGPLVFPGGSCVKVAFWILTLPLTMLMYCTIPDCRKPRWEAWYLITFFMSVVWIFIFSYIMVWMVCVIGFTLGIPDVIMGITFLAAGTSIPDCIASLLVAREGLGDMAISNSIGSNIFDILIGLALPWFIKTALMDTGMTVEISSKGMLYSVALLFASVFLTIFLVNCNKWQLTKPLGVMFFIIYVAFISVSACIEFNLFAFVNLPTCAYSG